MIAELKLRHALEEGERSAEQKGQVTAADGCKKYEVQTAVIVFSPKASEDPDSIKEYIENELKCPIAANNRIIEILEAIKKDCLKKSSKMR